MSMITALISVNPKPPLALYPPDSFLNPTLARDAAALSTPAGTPQPGVSPDTHGLTPAPTPSDAAPDSTSDPDSRLVDVTDETWGILLAHRMNHVDSIVDCRPSMASGLLIKRGASPLLSPSVGVGEEPHVTGPILLGVNILWLGVVSPNRPPATPSASLPINHEASDAASSKPPIGLFHAQLPGHRQTAEMLMKDVLTQYRGLGLLAKLKGMRGTKGGIIPWHICAAMRSTEALELCVPL